jgi:hypothetical protein
MANNPAGQTQALPVISQDATPYTQVSIAYDATAITGTDTTTVTVGFKARRVRITNLTSQILWEWFAAPGGDNYCKTAATGARTLVTTAGLVAVADRTIVISHNATAPAVITASGTVLVEAWG